MENISIVIQCTDSEGSTLRMLSKCVGNGRLHVSCYVECLVSNLVIPNEKKKSSIILSAFQIQDNTLYLFKFTSTVQYVYVFYIQCTYS